MSFVTSFEVLAQPIVPGVTDVPYVQQGSFLQLTNVGPGATTLIVGYTATPAFVASSGGVVLTANYIDDTGAVTMIDAGVFLTAPVGFPAVEIPSGGTFIFGVQYIIKPTQAAKKAGATPQDGAGTRGVVTLEATAGTQLVALATIRQVFNNFQPSGELLDVSEAAYSAPIIGGPVITF